MPETVTDHVITINLTTGGVGFAPGLPSQVHQHPSFEVFRKAIDGVRSRLRDYLTNPAAFSYHYPEDARSVTLKYTCGHKETFLTPGVADPAGFYWQEGEEAFPGEKQFELQDYRKCHLCEPKKKVADPQEKS